MPQHALQGSEASNERQEDLSVAAEASLDSQSSISTEPIWDDNEE
jgi:hypothetical protein